MSHASGARAVRIMAARIVCARSLRVAPARTLSQSASQSRCGEYERIADVYRGRSVLVTGGTGFVGKILIERLLYTCKDIRNIYVIIRRKADVTLENRLQGMFSLPVSMVFHTAASVSFKAQLKQLMDINYSGTRRVMELTRRMKNLESFVYFSTAFVNTTCRVLEEAPVHPLVSLEQVERCLRTGDTGDLLKALDAPMYIFSKGVAETLVVQERGELPTTIIRPSAVTACLRDPLPGWMDTWIAHPSFFVAHARGLVSAALGHRDVVADVIPVDYVANLAIVAAARGIRMPSLQVFNCCSGGAHPLSWQEGVDLFRQRAEADGRWDLPPKQLVFSTSPLIVSVLCLARDTLPALLRDLALVIRGERPRYMKMHLRARFIRRSCYPVMINSTFFKSSRTFLLSQSLDEADRAQFPFDPNTISWPEYLAQVYDGIYKYMLKKYSCFVYYLPNVVLNA